MAALIIVDVHGRAPLTPLRVVCTGEASIPIKNEAALTIGTHRTFRTPAGSNVQYCTLKVFALMTR